MKNLHSLFKRQLKRCFHQDNINLPTKEWENLIEAINKAYYQFDEDRKMLERSLELSSQELLQSNSEMQTVFRAFPDLFFRLQEDGTIVDYKIEKEADIYPLLGEVKGKCIYNLPSKEIGIKFQKAVEELKKVKSRVRIEYFIIINGKKCFYEARLLPLLEKQIIVIVRDITDRKKAEEELRKYAAQLEFSNQELKDFAYVASHDLQEPLRKIQAFSNRLKDKYSTVLGESGNDYLSRMQNAAERMQSLILDLLAYSRVTTKGQPFIPTDLNVIIKQVLSDLEVRIEQVEAKIELGHLLIIDADPVQMRQLFQNLISNALKFHRKNVPPVIKIYCQNFSTQNSCQITVEDNGIGFEEQYLERIFAVFQRLHGHSEYEGSGVGLAICRKIVGRHKGTITAKSILGQGSRFIVSLAIKQNIRSQE